MTDQLTAAGLEIDDLTTRKEALKTAVRAACGANLDLSTDQPEGQFIEIFAESVQAALEVLQEVYTSFDPDEATGDAQTALALISGTNRRAATYGTVLLKLTLDAAITVPAGSVAHVSGDPDNRWITDDDVTSVGAGDYTVTATCEDSGPVQALAGTITVIATPVVGWTAVTNDADAVEGLAVETDTELRLRRELELQLAGSASTQAIAADLLDHDDVTYARVYENVTDTVDAYGRPAHSIETVVLGAVTDADVAEQIYLSKAAGIATHGDTSTYHVDVYGISHPISFTRAAEVDIYVRIDIGVDPLLYDATDAELKAAIVAWGDANLGVNDDIAPSRIAAVAYEITGVKEVTLVYVEDAFPATLATRFPILWNEIGKLATARITVNAIDYVDL